MKCLIRGLASAVLASFAVVVVAAVALASEGSLPWDDLVISFGGTSLVWGAIVAGIIQIAKAIKVNGNPLLGTPQAIWLTNLALGGLGMFLYAYLGGASIVSALLQAVMAVLSASGAYEAVTAAGKGSQQSAQSGAGTR